MDGRFHSSGFLQGRLMEDSFRPFALSKLSIGQVGYIHCMAALGHQYDKKPSDKPEGFLVVPVSCYRTLCAI